MTSEESKALKIGEAVVFSDGVKGRVVSVGNAGVRMEWDDGQSGVINHDDMQDVSRVPTPQPPRAIRPQSLAREGYERAWHDKGRV
jgi:preprotein translocase subunit YajC